MNKQALTVGMQEWCFDVDLFRVGNYLACYSEQWSMTDERNHRLVLPMLFGHRSQLIELFGFCYEQCVWLDQIST